VGCAAGGAKLAEGLRVIEAGGGVAYRDAVETAKFGMAGRNGEAPKRYKLRSGFPVGYDKSGAMVGTVRQVRGGQLLGSFSAVDSSGRRLGRSAGCCGMSRTAVPCLVRSAHCSPR
ncbi:MAG TPA: hypothetical protein VGP44_05515, partial [Gemmatimonadales bacterium]|nr:hypothetical protein [Gemmatimonadales bacterium]